MRARQILSKNLRTLIEYARQTRPELGAIRKIAESSGGTLTNGTVGRIAAGTHTTDIDTLAQLSEVFGLEPWQLLVENLNPKALPQLADAALLSQIKALVESAASGQVTASTPTSVTDEQAVQTRSGSRSSKIGPALEEAFDVQGLKTNAGRTVNGVQKPQGGGRNQRAGGTRRTR